MLRKICLNGTLPFGVEHPWKGSPSRPDSHAQIARWSTTEHVARVPHAWSHGSLHFWPIQAKVAGHSALMVHSGRQFGGAPMKPDWQLHAGVSPEFTQIEFGPHGDGWQGFVVISGGGAVNENHKLQVSKQK